eukprot:983261-Rhodomonas_salina.3
MRALGTCVTARSACGAGGAGGGWGEAAWSEAAGVVSHASLTTPPSTASSSLPTPSSRLPPPSSRLCRQLLGKCQR